MENVELVSIPLFSGLVTDAAIFYLALAGVSIPLFSGLVTDLTSLT